MTYREADARPEVENFKDTTRPMRIRNVSTGEEITDPGDIRVMRDPITKKETPVAAPTLSPEEQTQAAEALRGALAAGQVRYPSLANHLLNNPEKLWLMGEIQMMLSSTPNDVSYDFTAELMEGLTTTDGQREEYKFNTAHNKTQQLFWEEIGKGYEGSDRNLLIDALSSLSEEGADTVAARALAWIDTYGKTGIASGSELVEEPELEGEGFIAGIGNLIEGAVAGVSGERRPLDVDARQQLFLNIANWAYMEQQHELGEKGAFSQILEGAQEAFEDLVVSPLINAGVGLISGAEEAARRQGLTPGEQVMFQAGVKMPVRAGDFGWWRLGSGAIDALVEVGGDPLAYVAGIGAGVKAAKTIPLASKATKAGRLAAAARSLLPKPLTGAAAKVSGGRFARVTYSLGAKTMDDLLEMTLKNGVAQSAMDLVKAGNLSRFGRLFPAWRGISDTAVRTIQEAVQTPDEFIEVLKADALNEVLKHTDDAAEAQAAAHRTEQALLDHIGHEKFVVDANLNDVVDNPDKYAFHATSPQAANGIEAGGFKGGTLVSDPALAIGHAETRAKLGEEAMIVAIPKSDLPPSVVDGLNKNGFHTVTNAPTASAGVKMRATTKFKVRDAIDILDGTKDSFRVSYEVGGEARTVIKNTRAQADELAGQIKQQFPGNTVTVERARLNQAPTFDELLLNQNIPASKRYAAATDRIRLNTLNNTSGHVFLLSEVPQRSKRVFSWDNVMQIKGRGRLATGVRRTAARITPGRIPNEIDLFNTRQGVDDLRRMGEHFGLEGRQIDELVQQFDGLELGARQEWVWDVFLRRLGRETGVPAFEHQLVQFYKGAGVRAFSGSGADLLDDGSRIPLLPTQMNAKMPVPVDVLNQVFKRARSIGTRSKLARAMGMNGRGLGRTAERRMQLVKSLRRQLGEQADELTDDQLHDMAFSLVSPNSGLDGRGIWAGKMMPKAGSWANNLHGWFTKSMLVFRPIQWMWRVALLEEPIRAHIFNLPSLYRNPLQYMARAREAHYIWNVRKWAEANMSWGQDVISVLNKGSRQDVLTRLDGLGLTEEVFKGNVPQAAHAVKRGVEQFVTNAVYGRTRPSKLNPIKRVPWSVKNRAHSIATAEAALKKSNLPEAFDFAEEAQEIAGRLVSGYLGEAVGAADRKLYQWATGLTGDEAFTHGRVWGTKMIEFVEDPFGRAGLRRRAALLRGETPDITGEYLVNSSKWEFMAPDLRRKYAGVGDDIAVAEAYMDDMLATEIDHLFKPFADAYSPDDLADILDEFAASRRIEATIGGSDIDWDLRSANYGGGVRQVGDFTREIRQNPTIDIPSNLPAPSFDPRFMAEDDVSWPSRMANWVLQTFGEDATQTINRRPAWIHEYKRWYDNYINLNIPAEHAQRLATDHANKMVNHVFFNMDEAPYYVAKLNKVLPFFGATYEVVGTWSYKMPVAVGGTWQQGVGEFARKFDRIVDGLVNIGLLTREEEDDGSVTLTLNLVPKNSDNSSPNELGAWLQGAGYAAVNTLDSAVSTLLGLEEGLGIRSQGYRLAAGHPLNPSDYGILSFAQADVGFNPATNILVTALAGRIPGATGPRREAVAEGESLADLADRLNMDVNELVRYNREVFVDTENFGSSGLYNGLLSGDIDPEDVAMPITALNLPGSSLWDAMADTFMPFGEIDSPHEFAASFIPSGFRWAMAGLALQNQPSDSFWSDTELKGMFGGMLPPINQAQVASQLNEAFMYLEAHDLVNNEGPFSRILAKEDLIQRGLNNDEEAIREMRSKLEINVGASDEAVINAFRVELDLDTQAFLDRAQKVAAESLIMRGITGQMLPTTPGHVRLEEQKIQEYWNSREHADSLRSGGGPMKLRNFTSMEELDQYKEQLASWLSDPTGDRARATFMKNNPQLMAYLTPKTFYTETVPDIQSYEEYQRQIESGERQPSPLHVTMWRARSAAIQADYYNKYISEFGGNPNEAAASALANREQYQALQDEKEAAYTALEMWDDMHGGVYDQWREENYQDVETWAQDQINDKLNKVRDNLSILFELEDNLDIELDLDGIANLNSSIRGAIAEISNAIRDYESLTEDTQTRNPYEQAIHNYFQQVYIPYAESLAELYDKLPEVADSERESLIYEQIKFIKNQHAGTTVYLDDDTSTPFPNPLDYSWQGKDKDEQLVKMQQWMTRPIEWMDLDQAIRIGELNPEMSAYLPSDLASFDIYREYTLKKIEFDELFENNEITRSVRNKAIKQLDEQLRSALIDQGRANEVRLMDMTPYEKLELSGMLPQRLAEMPVDGHGGILSDAVRYFKEALATHEQTPGTVAGRKMVAPLYNVVEQVYYSDPHMREIINELGINLQDETALDAFLPWLFFGYTGER